MQKRKMRIEYEDAKEWNLGVRYLIAQANWEELRFQVKKAGNKDIVEREVERIKDPKVREAVKEKIFGR